MEKNNENKRKPRGKFYVKAIKLEKPANSQLAECEECGGWPADKRFYSQDKEVCDPCAKKYWDIFLKSLTVGAVICAIIWGLS